MNIIEVAKKMKVGDIATSESSGEAIMKDYGLYWIINGEPSDVLVDCNMNVILDEWTIKQLS